jgi:DNA-binding response OmpR family regulator
MQSKLAGLHLAGARPCQVLVVDDDELVRERLAALLQSPQFNVTVAASGAEALRIMAEIHCHVLLTDWEMPGMDGLALCRNIRGHHIDRCIYIIMHTVHDGHEDYLAGLAAGADGYIIKGAPIAEFLAWLEFARRVMRMEELRRESISRLRHQSLVHGPALANTPLPADERTS